MTSDLHTEVEEPKPRRQLSRRAQASCMLGVAAPLSLAVIFGLQEASVVVLLLPLCGSAAALLLAVAALWRIALGDPRQRGILPALTGLILGGGTLLVVLFLYVAGEAIAHCPFLG